MPEGVVKARQDRSEAQRPSSGSSPSASPPQIAHQDTILPYPLNSRMPRAATPMSPGSYRSRNHNGFDPATFDSNRLDTVPSKPYPPDRNRGSFDPVAFNFDRLDSVSSKPYGPPAPPGMFESKLIHLPSSPHHNAFNPPSVGPAHYTDFNPPSVGPAHYTEFNPPSVGPAHYSDFDPPSVGPAKHASLDPPSCKGAEGNDIRPPYPYYNSDSDVSEFAAANNQFLRTDFQLYDLRQVYDARMHDFTLFPGEDFNDNALGPWDSSSDIETSGFVSYSYPPEGIELIQKSSNGEQDERMVKRESGEKKSTKALPD